MRAFAAVFAREVVARRIVFFVALPAGLLPLFGSLYYGWSKPDAAEGRILVALVMAAAFSIAFALLFGGAVIAGETSEKRISFFFSRPLSASAIWGGKLAAVLFLTFVPAALVLLPAFATSTARARQSVFRLGGAPGAVLSLLLVTLFIALAAHAAVTIARLRSPWAAVDLLLGPALVFLCALFLRTLVKYGLPAPFLEGPDLAPVFPALAGAVLAALAVASFVQVAAGRADAVRAHGAFSVVLWGILAAATAALGGYTFWCASATATDLAEVAGSAHAAPRGPWLVAGGPLRAGRGSGAFLFDAASGRSLRLREWNTAFSPDGARAVWGEPRFGFLERKDNRADLRLADLASGRVVETGLETEGWAGLALSPSGRRLAVLDGRTLSAYEVSDAANPKQLATFRVGGESPRFAFAGEDTIRIFPRFLNAANRKELAAAAFEITELSLPSKKSSVTGRFDRETLPFLRLAADGRFFVGTRRLTEDPNGASALTLHDGRTGATVATLGEDLRNVQARFMTGNRIAIAGIANSRAKMKIFSEGEEGRGAAPARTIDLGPAKRLVLGGEIAPGRIALSLLPFEENLPASPRTARLALVDVSSGAVSFAAEGLVPADRFAWWWFSPVLPPAEAGSPASSLFLDADGRLVRLDPATGARTVLLGKGK